MMIEERSEPKEFYKPLSIARDELMSTLIDAANNSGLPLVVIEYIARDFYTEVKNTAAMQYEKDKEDYEEILAQQKNDETQN